METNKVKPPYQGPDPYNAWQECERNKSNMQIRLLENISELIKAEKIVRAAQAFVEEYDSSLDSIEELESFDKLISIVKFYNGAK